MCRVLSGGSHGGRRSETPGGWGRGVENEANSGGGRWLVGGLGRGLRRGLWSTGRCWRRRGRWGRGGTDGGGDGWRRRDGDDGSMGLKLAELFGGAEPIASGGFGAPEDQGEGFGALAILEEGCAEREFLGLLLLGDEGIENLSFEAEHAALGPIGGDDLFDEEGFLGAGGLEVVEVGGGELGERGFVLTGDDEGLSGGGVLQSIEAGGGLALDGAGAGGFLGVEPVGGDLSGSCHQ